MYNPQLKKDISLIMIGLAALARDTADRIDSKPETPEDVLDRIKHKFKAFVELDEALSDRADLLLHESILETPGVERATH